MKCYPLVIGKVLILLLFLLRPVLGSSQHSSPADTKQQELQIQEISLENSFLKKLLEDFQRKMEDQYPLFKSGFGYIVVNDIHVNRVNQGPLWMSSSPTDTTQFQEFVASFSVGLEGHPFVVDYENDCFLCSEYPQYYTFINQRPVLIYDDVLTEVLVPHHSAKYTRRSIKRLIRVIEPCLKASLKEDFLFINPLAFPREFHLPSQQRKGMSRHEIFKKAVFTMETFPESYYLRRDGKIISIPDARAK